MKYLACLLLLFPVSAETLKVADHPAKLLRSITGFTEPSAFLDIKAEFAGRLEKIHVQEGKTLNGDSAKILLAKQDSILAEIELERTKAALASEKQILQKLAAEKSISKREVKYRLLEKKRLEKLAESGKATQASYDMAIFEYDKASLLVTNIDASIIVQEQAIKEHEVAVKKANENLSRYSLYGPAGWIVNERYVEPGSMLAPGEKIFQLVNTQILSAYFRLNETEIEALNENDLQLRIKKTQKKIEAKIHRIDLGFDPNSRKRLVEIRISSNQLPAATGGIELELILQVPYPAPAVKIPAAYVFNRLEQDYVKLTNGNIIALIPLRKTEKEFIVNLDALPKGAELLKVEQAK